MRADQSDPVTIANPMIIVRNVPWRTYVCLGQMYIHSVQLSAQIITMCHRAGKIVNWSLQPVEQYARAPVIDDAVWRSIHGDLQVKRLVALYIQFAYKTDETATRNILLFEELKHAVRIAASLVLSTEQQALILLKSFFISFAELGFMLPRKPSRGQDAELLPQNPMEYTDFLQRLRKLRTLASRGDNGNPLFHNKLNTLQGQLGVTWHYVTPDALQQLCFTHHRQI